MRELVAIVAFSVQLAAPVQPSYAQAAEQRSLDAPMRIELPSGVVVPVYRIRYRMLREGPAIQVEYATAHSLADTAALLREVASLWPAIVRFAEGAKAQYAILTAIAPPTTRGVGPLRTVHTQQFGFVVDRASRGGWVVEHYGRPLPPSDKTSKARVVDRNGRIVPPPSSAPEYGRGPR